MADTSIQAVIEEGGYDFIDFGCSDGKSIEYAMVCLGGKKGLGIDLSGKKVALAREAGYDAVVADATDVLCRDGAVRFCIVRHFLEHLPTRMLTEQCIKTAIRVAREFVYIRQPWFEGSAELLSLGYKPYWADWNGHPNHYSALDFVNVLSRVPAAKRFLIFGNEPILSTRNPCLVPLSAPEHSQAASDEEVRAREDIALPGTMFRELVCIIQVGTPEEFEWPMARMDRHHRLLYDSAAKLGGRSDFRRPPPWRRLMLQASSIVNRR